jgi:hypothetical protein
MVDHLGRSGKGVREMATRQFTESGKRRTKNTITNEKRTGVTYFDF